MNNIDLDLAGMQKHIKPLNMNGLDGRMLRVKATKESTAKAKKREILLIYGHHSSLERMYGFAEVLQGYGNVSMPDLPGFGGMDSLHKLGIDPTLDHFADYMAAFIKMRYKRKKFIIAGFSFGFVIATRMLQRYPELTKQVTLIISIAGFSHKYDFSLSPGRQRMYRLTASVIRRRIPAALFYNVGLHPSVVRRVYKYGHNSKSKFKGLEGVEVRAALEFETKLWRINDVRTHMSTALQMLTLDNCKVQVDIPVHHISIGSDQYFDSRAVEQHMRVIFTDFTEHHAEIDKHAPSIIARREDARPLFPDSIFLIIEAH